MGGKTWRDSIIWRAQVEQPIDFGEIQCNAMSISISTDHRLHLLIRNNHIVWVHIFFFRVNIRFEMVDDENHLLLETVDDCLSSKHCLFWATLRKKKCPFFVTNQMYVDLSIQSGIFGVTLFFRAAISHNSAAKSFRINSFIKWDKSKRLPLVDRRHLSYSMQWSFCYARAPNHFQPIQ